MALSACTLGAPNEFHEELLEPRVRALDSGTLSQLHAWSSSPLTRLMEALTFMGDPLVLATATGRIALLLLALRSGAIVDLAPAAQVWPLHSRSQGTTTAIDERSPYRYLAASEGPRNH